MTPIMKLVNALNAVISALQELAQQQAKAEMNTFENIYPPPETEEKSAEPTKEITVADVRKLLAEKSRMGYKAEVMELVHKHGADKVSSLKESEYAAVMKEAEQIGK